MRVLKPLVLAALLAGCSTAADRAAYLNRLIGHSETDVVQQLGMPDRAIDTDGHRFLAYDSHSSATFFGGPVVGGFYGAGYYPFWPDTVVTRQCETTVELTNGRVATWSLRGLGCG